MVGRQLCGRFLAQARRGNVEALAVVVDEVVDQRKDVARALAQCGQLHRGDIEAVVEVEPKVPGLYRLLQVDVGGGDQAHVHRNGFARAQPHHLALLQHAQQLDLHRQRQIADFVKEQRAAVGGFEPAGPSLLGTGKRASFVAE